MVEMKEMPRIQELESCFLGYPDVPREVTIKQDLLRLGHWFTDAAMERARDSLVKSYRQFSYDLVGMEQLSRKEHRRVPEWFMVRDGVYGLRPILVQTTLNPLSPYVVDVVEDDLKLVADGKTVCDVRFPSPMEYYNKAFDDGTPYHEIIAWGYFVTVFRYCQYWGPNEECRFCDINYNARQMKESKDFVFSAPVKPLSRVVEVAGAIQEEVTGATGFPVPIDFLITGGTITNKLRGKAEDDFYLEYVEALKWSGRRRYVILQVNAKDRETLKRYRGAGVDCYHANMEVWDRQLFEWINPGKNRRIGYDNWVRCLLDSVDVFGEGNVRPNFVCGMEMAQPHGFKTVEEAVSSTTEGLDFLMKHGVLPRLNTWRREPHS